MLVLAGGSIGTPAGADLKQVIPFIDANLRTIATKKARAVAGVSMGGLGAFHYAQARPDLYSQTASLSGDIALSANSMDLGWPSRSPSPTRWARCAPRRPATATPTSPPSSRVWTVTRFRLALTGVQRRLAVEPGRGRPGHALLLRQLRRRFRLGARCNGGPTAGCWEQDLQDLIPRLERAFAS
ncbi:alpha/beta hydrolase-fold protein [Streptomyces sp. NPDC006527]|uniref:alpha/beta hydrolase-fold protein n=1 Tax=Streptomyces sp. NPDC006527 TaxID=3364749 RepID=UPI0036C61A6C